MKTFQNFAQSVEKFLTSERGFVETKQSAIRLNQTIQTIYIISQKIQKSCNFKINNLQFENKKVIEKISKVSEHVIKIKHLLEEYTDKLKFQIIEDVAESWNEWIKVGGVLEYRLSRKAETWFSNRDPVWEQHGIVEAYTILFIRDISNEINIWANKDFAEILKPKLENLDAKICFELKAIEQGLDTFEEYTHSFNSKKVEKFNFDVSQKGLYGDLWRWVTCILLVGYFFGSGDEIKNQMKAKVLEECLAEFRKLSSEIIAEIYETTPSVLESRFKSAEEIITRAILSYEARLEQQERDYRKILEQCEAKKACNDQQRRELMRVQKNIEAILNQCGE